MRFAASRSAPRRSRSWWHDRRGAIRFRPSSSFLRSPKRGCSASIMTRRAGAGARSHSRQGHRQCGGPYGRKLTRLPVETQAALQQLACLGNVRRDHDAFDRSREIERQGPSISGAPVAWSGRAPGRLVQVRSHDRIQEAAYSLIPERLRAEAHLRIGSCSRRIPLRKDAKRPSSTSSISSTAAPR